MSYTHIVKDELLHTEIKNKKEIELEIYTILKVKNAIFNDKIELKVENIGIAKRVYTFFKNYSNLKIFVKYSTSKSFGEHKVYTIFIPYQKEFVKVRTEFLKLEKEKVAKDDNLYSSYLRGIFLASGYIKSPDKEYSMDFFIETEESAKKLYDILIQHGKRAFITVKKNKHLVYLRNSEDIMDVLVSVKAMKTFFDYEDVTVVKDLKNKTIRSMNWELANETKAIGTAQKQVKMIRYIERTIGLEELTKVLKEVADVRLENPELSLVEIAEIIGITKSGVRNRFRRIEAIYEQCVTDYGKESSEFMDELDDYYDEYDLENDYVDDSDEDE